MVHGEKDSADEFAEYVEQKLGIEAVVPEMGETVEIDRNKAVTTGRSEPAKSGQKADQIQLSDVTLKIMQIKVKFMEAMDSLNRSVESGQIDAGEAAKILEEIQQAIDEEKAG